MPEYFGDPYIGCKPECISNNDCARDKACIQNKCKDPCPGVCGINAFCQTFNHNPTCSCNDGYTGDPLSSCRVAPQKLRKNVKIYFLGHKTHFLNSTANEPTNPCIPSPCGPNSQCREIDSHAVCSCSSNYIGMPPSCRPECITSSECPQDKACVREKCIDPCPGTCGSNARCQVLNHNPICSCAPGYTGDPFVQCQVERSEIEHN